MCHRLVSFFVLFVLFVSTTICSATSGFQSALSLTAGTNPRVVLAGDFNGDGKADIVVANNPGGGATNTIVTLLGNGDGTFQSAITSASSDSLVAVAQGDFNKDGKLDIVVVDQTLQKAVLMLGDGTGHFTQAAGVSTCATEANPTGIVAGDLNNDGKLDIAIVNQGFTGVAGTVTVCLGNGDGTFGTPSSFQAADFGVVATPDPLAITIGDLNNDGKLDLVVALHSNAFSVLRGNGNGTFQLPSTQILFNLSNPEAVSVADLNKDGKADVIVTTSDGVTVLLGNGDLTLGSPTTYSAPGWLTAVAITDLNGDGNPDVVTTNAAEGDIYVLLNIGNGQLGPAVRYAAESAPSSLAVADLNGDHSVDVIVANNGIPTVTTGTLTLAFGNGDGSLRAGYPYHINPPGISSGSNAVVAGDFNNDGRTDLAALFSKDSVSILTADSSYSFHLAGTYSAGNYSSDQVVGLAAGDVNGDGKLDLIVTGLTQFDVLLGTGNGTFQSPKVTTIPYGLTHGVALADVNGDGKLDLIYTSATTAKTDVAVAFGNGDGTFQPPSIYTVGSTPYSVIAVDLNNDQKLDLVTANSGGTLAYLMNNGDGTFGTAQQLMTGGYTTGVVAIDFNHDGKIDLVAMNSGNGNPANANLVFFPGNGNGTFGVSTQRLTGVTLNGIVGGDFRNIGDGDVVAIGGQTALVFWGTQDGTVPTNPSKVSAGAAPLGITAADLLAGGSGDLAIAEGNDRVALLPNLGGTRPVFGSSVNPSVYNQTVALTSQFTPVLSWVGSPTGSVNFLEGSQVLGVAPVLSSNEATLPFTFTSVGTHHITAAYSGDSNFNPRSVSASQQVNQASVELAVVPSPTSADPGTPITFTATLTPAYGGTATGTVTLSEGSTALASQPLANNTATFAISKLPVGIHSVSATYAGDTNFLASSSAPTQAIVRMTPVVSLASSAPSSGAGYQVTLTATVTGPLVAQAAGTVDFMNGSTQLGSATTNSSGIASLTTSALPAGSLTLTAVYVANSYSDSATSNAVAVTITPDYTVSATQTTATVRAGQAANYTLSISGFGGFNVPVSFTCSGQPLNATCSFAPSTVTPSGANPVTTVLTVHTAGSAAALYGVPMQHHRSAILAFSLGSFGFAGIALLNNSRRRWFAILIFSAIVLVCLTSCGGGGSNSGGGSNTPSGPVTPSGTSTITVTASATVNGATVSHQIPVTLVVNP